MEPIVICRRHEPRIAIVTLNRPQKRNALTIALMQQICRHIEDLQRDDECRCVILCGAGPAFCAGLDLIEAAEAEKAIESAKWVSDTLELISSTSLVTIAAVHGAAFAGGAGLMSACDLVVAADDLRVCFPEVRRGLVPALVANVLCGRLRQSEMRELFLMAEPVGANRAREMGLVHRIVAAEKLISEAIGAAETVCKGSPQAVRQTKQLIRQIGPAAAESMAAALAMHTNARRSEEAEEGLAAFRERREPKW